MVGEESKRRSRKGLVAGLVVGGIVGVAAIMWFAPRSNGQRAGNLLADLRIGDVVVQAEAYLSAAREQVREALHEGKVTSAETQRELRARYEAVRANPDTSPKY